jgi:menaquinone-dependent protoporphyrinogen oxidase
MLLLEKKEKNQPDTNPYMKKFLELSAWQPDKLAVFAGRIDYPSYRFSDRLIIRFIMLITKGPTDTSQTYEFTDWNKVANFAKEIL